MNWKGANCYSLLEMATVNEAKEEDQAMTVRFVLTEYVDPALSQAVYDKLEDDSFVGRIPACKGVIAFGTNLRECEDELRSTLEDWFLVGLKFGHSLPVIGRIDLNKEPVHESLDADRLQPLPELKGKVPEGWKDSVNG